MSFLNIILFGAPGCGKGTQSAILKSHYNLFHLSTGDLLREIKNDSSSPFYTEINEKISKGELVSDEILFQILEAKIASLKNSTFKGIIFDGFPRNKAQGVFLENLLSKFEMKVNYAILLNANQEIIIDRILNRFTCTKCGAVYNRVSKQPKQAEKCDDCGSINTFSARVDDTVDVIKNRLNIFNSNMNDIKTLYENNFVEVDASMTPENIFNFIKKTLENF